jgi:uncharacterized membrane protein
MENAEHYIARWADAGLLDAPTVAAIREFEAAQVRPGGRQWQVILALLLGGILLGAGVLLFVAAHWDNVSPLSRLGLVLFMLVFFHGLALLVQGRFAGLATALHAVGTVSAGATIALIGQIFNMQEHWPGAILLWSLCAAAGWYLLRDPFQKTLTLLLFPAGIVSEFEFRVDPYGGASIYVARILAVLAVFYLTGFLRERKRTVFGILFAVGAVMLPISIGMLTGGWNTLGYHHWGFVPLSYRLTAIAVMLAIGATGAIRHRRSVPPIALVAALAYALPWCQRVITESVAWGGRPYTEPNLIAHALVSGAAVALIAWGVRTLSTSLVNYGVVAFAMTVIWFYFSSVMDKLGRSLGLIVLGVLFLAGGWALELTRRKLLVDIAGGKA